MPSVASIDDTRASESIAAPDAALPEGSPALKLGPAGSGAVPNGGLPEDEAEWGKLNVVFATAKGSVRRNSMDAFTNIPSNGKYAMRFEEGSEDRLIGVALTEPGDDVLLASRDGFEATRRPGVERFLRIAAPSFEGLERAEIGKLHPFVPVDQAEGYQQVFGELRVVVDRRAPALHPACRLQPRNRGDEMVATPR